MSLAERVNTSLISIVSFSFAFILFKIDFFRYFLQVNCLLLNTVINKEHITHPLADCVKQSKVQRNDCFFPIETLKNDFYREFTYYDT